MVWAAAGRVALQVGIAVAEEVLSDDDDSETVSGAKQDIGNGHSMQLDPEAFRALLHHPTVVAAITARAEAIRDQANNLKITKGAEYIVTVQNRPETTRARARVRPGGEQPFKGMVDDAYHSTLYKAMSGFPSDPIPSGGE